MRTGWKVVKMVYGHYYSCNSHINDGGVEYIPGSATKPNKGCGPLCVFNTQRTASNFLKRYKTVLDGSTVRKCRYEPSRGSWVWDGHSTALALDLPKGTSLALSVVLVEG